MDKAEINSSRCYYSNYEDGAGNLTGRSFAYKCDTDTSNIDPSPNLGPM